MLPTYDDNGSPFSLSSLESPARDKATWYPGSDNTASPVLISQSHDYSLGQKESTQRAPRKKKNDSKLSKKRSSKHAVKNEEIEQSLDELRELMPNNLKTGKQSQDEIVQNAISHIQDLVHILKNHPRLKGMDPRILAAPGNSLTPLQRQEILLQQRRNLNRMTHSTTNNFTRQMHQGIQGSSYKESPTLTTGPQYGAHQERARARSRNHPSAHQQQFWHQPEQGNTVDQTRRLHFNAREETTESLAVAKRLQLLQLLQKKQNSFDVLNNRMISSSRDPQPEYIQHDHFQRPPQRDYKTGVPHQQHRVLPHNLQCASPAHGSTPYPRTPIANLLPSGSTRQVLQARRDGKRSLMAAVLGKTVTRPD